MSDPVNAYTGLREPTTREYLGLDGWGCTDTEIDMIFDLVGEDLAWDVATTAHSVLFHADIQGDPNRAIAAFTLIREMDGNWVRKMDMLTRYGIDFFNLHETGADARMQSMLDGIIALLKQCPQVIIDRHRREFH